jgi:archaellum component FlaC
MAVAKVTVVTVCLNVRDTIRLTLESVARQTFPNMEHVIIDGVSTDGTLDIIREYPVAYLSSEKDKGVYDAMDKGSRAVTGDIVIFLNAGDTFYDDEVCEKVAAFFDESGADIVFGDLLPVYLKPSDTHDHGAFTSGQVLDLSYVVNRRNLYNESIHHQATFYRRWVVKKCTYACAQPEATGEYNVLLKAVMKLGAKVKHVPLPISRFALGGISTGNFEKEWARYVKARDILRSLYYPSVESVRIKDELEFRHAPLARPLTRIERRTVLKERIKALAPFKIYDRLARGITARIVNQLAAELHAARQHGEVQSYQLLMGVEANFRAHLAETKGEIHQVRRDLEQMEARHKADLARVKTSLAGRLDGLVAIPETLEQVRDQVEALGKSAARQDALKTMGVRIDQIGADLRIIDSNMAAIREQTSGADRVGQTIDRIADHMNGHDALLNSVGADLKAFAATLTSVHDQAIVGNGKVERIADHMNGYDALLNNVGADLKAFAATLTSVHDQAVAGNGKVDRIADYIHGYDALLSNVGADLKAFAATLTSVHDRTIAGTDKVDRIADYIHGYDALLNNVGADLKAFAATLTSVHDQAAAGTDKVLDRLESQSVTLRETRGQLSQDLQSTGNAVLRYATLSEQRDAHLKHELMGVRANLGLMRIEGRENPTFEQNGVKVFSQWDEDGLIDHIVAHCEIPNRSFVEIGIGDYTEANTRFLLTERGWSGVVVDSTTADIEKLRGSEAYWRYPLTALNSFVAAENVNEIIATGGLKGDIGLLSIDIDGMDYWIWNAIEVVSPRIVVCEYNGIFGSKAAVTVPYEPAFDRRTKHYSWLYGGTSLGALGHLAARKGYTLVGCNAGGNNAFFVRNDVMAAGDLKPSARPYRKPVFRESRNPDGTLSFLDVAEGVKLIRDLPVYDVARDKTIKIADVDLVF